MRAGSRGLVSPRSRTDRRCVHRRVSGTRTRVRGARGSSRVRADRCVEDESCSVSTPPAGRGASPCARSRARGYPAGSPRESRWTDGGCAMARGDVETVSKNGQWVNRVEGEAELSQGYASKEEAVEEGARLAAETGARHTVRDAPATGVVTDEQESDEGESSGDDVIDVEDLP